MPFSAKLRAFDVEKDFFENENICYLLHERNKEIKLQNGVIFTLLLLMLQEWRDFK